MASAEESSDIIRKLRGRLIEILHSDADSVLDELDSVLLITKEEYFKLNEIADPRKKIRALLNSVLQKGETACQAFLASLQKLHGSFPKLNQLSEDASRSLPILCGLQEEKEEDLSENKSALRREEKDNTHLKGADEGIEGVTKEILESLDELAIENKGHPFLHGSQEELDEELNDSERAVRREEKENTSLKGISGGTEGATEEVVESSVELEMQNKDRRKAFEDILCLLKLDNYESAKLGLRDVLEIGQEDLRKTSLQSLEDMPWHLLKKIMALNVTARNTSLENNTTIDQATSVQDEKQTANGNIFSRKRHVTRLSVNPLDVLCALLHCSDSFLQQEIMSKMSMCQFALPLLLPPCDGTKCTFMLWAMRDIVRKWRPHSLRDSRGFRAESLVLTPMPIISFVRLGGCSLSKSRILNEVLSPPQQHHDFFLHQNMESGNVPRKISDGLVEISWYFPGGKENSDIFPEPVAVTNLRGDLESHWLQFSFLTKVSSAVLIIADSITERGFTLLSSLEESKTKYIFLLNPQSDTVNETLEFLNKLAPIMKLTESSLLEKDKTMNDADFVKQVQSAMLGVAIDPSTTMTIEDMAVTARELGVQVDEDSEECQRACKSAKEITEEINDVVEYKKEMMKLQGDLWKRLAKVEKEFCQMKKQGDTPPENYRSQLRSEWLEIRRQQNKCDFTDSMTKFIVGLGQPPKAEKHYFLKWMKFNLDRIARSNLSTLRDRYKRAFSVLGDDPTLLIELDRRISESSLGVEHFMRELGQFYEAECSMVQEGKLRKKHRQCMNLPSIAADLLLEGFPLELIDGDASNIPLQWITDVLTALNTKLGGQCRILVITVLGVQSTGKSTLLNAMFGLQFSVSSGRCTRGAFMLLIKVKDNLMEELGCDFILVIDTEGLKAPELATLEDSYEHDNELATLVIGLSDITIINMAMENATEMKDILQIVVHAFLRMEEIGKKPNCQFVHQNVSDVSAHEQNMRDRKHLLEQLNEMTKAAARMEKQSRDITFSDIMEYDPEKHNWYIPGLWHGVPPMAPVNTGYSENVHALKRYLFEIIQNRSQSRDSNGIPKFIEWLKSLWNAVKHENFIFSFRNSLVADAYNQLAIKFSEWEWVFCKEMYLWVAKAEAGIENQSIGELDSNIFNSIRQAAYQKLQYGEQNMLDCIEKYFSSGAQNLHLIEKYREDFIRSAKWLKKSLECYTLCKCEEAITIQKSRNQIEDIQAKYMKTIEGKVVSLLEDCRKKKCKLTGKKLKKEFGNMWEQTLSELHLSSLQKRNISQDMYLLLRKDLESRGSSVNQMLQKVQNLSNHGKGSFSIRKEHLDLPVLRSCREFFTQECSQKASALADALMNDCNSYVEGKVSSKMDYDTTYCRELLNMINERLCQSDVQKLHITACFEVELKLHVLGRAAQCFQKMHDNFIKKNDPKLRLEKFRPQYFNIFKNLYLKKDECQQRARDFCDHCLKPALADYVNKRLGLELIEDIIGSGQSIEYSSRTFFQFTILETLLEDNDFDTFVRYINNYEHFAKTWILQHILERYEETTDLEDMEKKILSTMIMKVREVLRTSADECTDTVAAFLESFCKAFQNDLVISKDSLEVIIFQNNANVKSFSDDINVFLTEMESHLLTEFSSLNTEEKLQSLPFKPQDELFKKVFGCGKQCPFCKVPCEAGGIDHKEHFASVHRPQGLGQYRSVETEKLVYDLCSSYVVSNVSFRNSDTQWKDHPYKDYRNYYPDWRIQPDPSIDSSNYWKFIFNEFNQQFAEKYVALPAELPDDWSKISKKQALKSIQEVFNMNET